MGFLSALGKIGKVAAPIAAGIFGGPGAAAAVSGGLGALDKKMHGGSWKDALVSGGINAGTSYGMGKGLGPSKGVTDNLSPKPGLIRSGIENTKFGNSGGFLGKLGGALKNPAVLAGAGGLATGALLSRGGGRGYNEMGIPGMPSYQGTMRGLGPTMGRMDQNFPNLAESIGAGRQDAMSRLNIPAYGGAQIDQPRAVNRPVRQRAN